MLAFRATAHKIAAGERQSWEHGDGLANDEVG
jgi:hypothetical protein